MTRALLIALLLAASAGAASLRVEWNHSPVNSDLSLVKPGDIYYYRIACGPTPYDLRNTVYVKYPGTSAWVRTSWRTSYVAVAACNSKGQWGEWSVVKWPQ